VRAVVGLAARLAVIQPAGQFTEQQQVGAFQDLGLERSRRLQPRPDPRRPQVGVETQLAANLQERGLRTLRRRGGIEGRITDRSEQDAVGGAGGDQRLVGQRRQSLLQRDAADDAGREREVMMVPIRDGAQNPLRGGDDFRTDAVAREKEDGTVRRRGRNLFRPGWSRSR
jgi:hypothetical protein